MNGCIIVILSKWHIQLWLTPQRINLNSCGTGRALHLVLRPEHSSPGVIPAEMMPPLGYCSSKTSLPSAI